MVRKYLSVLKPGKQCFDVVAEWAKELGVPNYPGNPSPFPYEYAYQIYTNFGEFQAKYFNRIENSFFNTPKPGSIIVWKPGYNNGAGHTAVVVRAGLLTFDAFSQNDPVGSRCSVKTYSYGLFSTAGVYGWLEPKDKSAEELIKTIKEKINTNISDTNYRNWERELLGV